MSDYMGMEYLRRESEKAAGESPVQILRHEELYQRLRHQYAAGTAGVQFQFGVVRQSGGFPRRSGGI